MKYHINRSSEYKLLNFVFSFGVTMLIVLYLSYRGGVWLDQVFNTEPICMITMVILAIVANIRVMIRDLNLVFGDPKRDH